MLVKRVRFFRDPWNVFDFLIVGVSLLTFIPQLSVSRSLRILRIFLLISFMPRLRFIVQSLLLSLPGIFGISILLAVVFYVFAVIATQTFGYDNPYTFGSLNRSLYSIFRIMTLDGCWTIVNKALKNHRYAYFFFIPFILFSSYIILNIFIAIIINSMREARLRSEEKARKAERDVKTHEDAQRSEHLRDELMKKLNEIDARIRGLE
ncbi:MAG: ion transporter [Desulfovibrio sp.]|nr:ion transporter [Desulfovibrio sp.]